MENNKITRVFPDFADELMKLDPRISVIPNPNRTQLANIKIDGTDVCPIPAFEIRDDADPSYTMELPNGRVMHRSRNEALTLVKETLNKIDTDKDYSDRFFGRNGY